MIRIDVHPDVRSLIWARVCCLMPSWQISGMLTQTCLANSAFSSCLQGISIGWFGVRVVGFLSLCVRKCFPLSRMLWWACVPGFAGILLEYGLQRPYIWSLRLRWGCPKWSESTSTRTSDLWFGLECVVWCLRGRSLAFSRNPVSPSVCYPLVFKGSQSVGLEYESLVFYPYT